MRMVPEAVGGARALWHTEFACVRQHLPYDWTCRDQSCSVVTMIQEGASMAAARLLFGAALSIILVAGCSVRKEPREQAVAAVESGAETSRAEVAELSAQESPPAEATAPAPAKTPPASAAAQEPS